MSALPDMQLFRDVPVVPVAKARRTVVTGGPIWPKFETQVAARHCRGGVAQDTAPRPPTGRIATETRPAVWGGYLIRHFGHLVAEQLTRLPQSLRDRPDDICLFTVPPEDRPETLPGYIWDVLDWHGVRRDRVVIVSDPCLVQTLHVAAQGEMLGQIPTATEYLDLLEDRARRNALLPERHRLVFVTRAGLVPAGGGGHAGEGYLATLLEGLGVRILDPGRVSLREQLALYAGASVLLFSEGSALHGRTLVGRVRQEIHVLRRRPQRNTARLQLKPRCRHLAYHETVAGKLGTETDTRASRVDREVALYDRDALFVALAEVGIDLSPVWDDTAYRAAAEADLAGWMAANPTTPGQRAVNEAVLARLGLTPDFTRLVGAPA
ncbi:MAG: glycosyltransferase 61 family protein [Tabrizicola sp.]|uniref:glycosyltransferase 61 family protein n=1 Tax=Tabrizicola sp. TaxID=2005166 RepID=UPI0027365266|nr:glycosyltransferase 61 family protein [Tabrizicola sp.]MDP3261845.1 glycosyltransferase 61 family protein [Tabrizicola sp.]MDP3649547.1 glycosyltransferase 61 family protein [Paracoccaceae bacterium]MDZ4068047.1 glycosyltransferase 61 family protein [Tabrizicola sp.]